MKTIYKYELEIEDTQQVETYRYASILSAQMQNGKLVLWLMVDLDEPKQKITVSIFGTGHVVPDNFYVGHEHNNYVNSVQDGQLVWHVFATGSFTASF